MALNLQRGQAYPPLRQRVALTRPAGRGEGLAERLRGIGAAVEMWPLLRIEPRTLPPIATEDEPDLLIFTSPAAVEHGRPQLPERWSAKPLYAVGRATADLLTLLGWPGARYPLIENTEGLLAMDALQQVEGLRIRIVRGNTGRPVLAEQLRIRGADVRYYEVYERLPPVHETAQGLLEFARDGGVILITSGEALSQLCAIIPGPLRRQVVVVTAGERIGEFAAREFPRVHVAAGADEDKLFAACQRALRQR